MSNIFEQASKKKIRFNGVKGKLNVEDLWDLPLSELDTIAKGLRNQLRQVEEESFIETRTQPNSTLTLEFDIVVHVIKARLDQAKANEQAAYTRAMLEKIRAKKEAKKDAALDDMSVEDLDALEAQLLAKSAQ